MSRKSSLENSKGPSNASNLAYVGRVLLLIGIIWCVSGPYKLIKAAGKAAVKGVRMML